MSKRISLVLDDFSEKGLNILESKAKKQGQFFVMSDVIREAIRVYFDKEGIIPEIQEKVTEDA